MLGITVEPHPSLHATAFATHFPGPIKSLLATGWLERLLSSDAEAPLRSDDVTRSRVRDMLRHGGYKPTGRGKPASEYLLRASGERMLKPINAAVDICNVVSLHSGLPISVIDLDLAEPPFRIGIGGEAHKYLFNAAGQEIDLSGLVCLFDAQGPCANAVKDSQRTKTRGETIRTLSVIWGAKSLAARVEEAAAWYRVLSEKLGAECTIVELTQG